MITRYVTGLNDDAALARHRRAAGQAWPRRVALVCPGIEDNLGDLAIHDATRALGEELGVYLDRVPYLSRERRLARLGLSARRYFDGALLGGGTLINGYWLDQVEAWGDMVEHAWTFGTGVGSSGFSQGPGFTLDPRWVALLSRFAAVGVRGPISARRLEEAGVPRVEVVGDTALGLAATYGAGNGTARDRFLVNVAGAPEARRDEVETSIALTVAAARELASAGLRPLPVAFTPWDSEPTAEAIARLGYDEPVLAHADVPALMTALGTCATGIAVRLHGSILAAAAGAPVLLFAYRDKAWDYLDSIDARRLGLDDTVTPDGAAARARELAAELDQMGAHVLERSLHWAGIQRAYAQRTWGAA
ncbi:polysaccharide pyruvyl transferase family protein [Demequina subtropica]|uniref:polysaccharide pyruvyl transferase family protein n=1 Tax=Demequina subtropica TaxID=1638989 RepID=UPI000783B8FA|nr:polysaccharide pyruvyl transferase family protein [Demequina subtropica]